MKLFIGFVIAAALLIAAFTLTPGAGAQSRQQQQPRQSPSPQPTATPQEVGEDDVIRVNCEIVTRTATVTDPRGCYRAGGRRKSDSVGNKR